MRCVYTCVCGMDVYDQCGVWVVYSKVYMVCVVCVRVSYVCICVYMVCGWILLYRACYVFNVCVAMWCVCLASRVCAWCTGWSFACDTYGCRHTNRTHVCLGLCMSVVAC